VKDTSRYHSTVAWYKEWFGTEYLEIYSHRDQGEAERHIDFVMRTLGGAPPRAVLDLACGAGRHTQALRRRGIRALGADLSLVLLSEPPRQPGVAADMCCLPFARDAFSWVLNFFTSFGYFESERQNVQVLEEIHRVLEPGGRFLIDLFNRQQVVDNLVPRESQQRAGYDVDIERWFDERTQRVNKRIRVHGPGTRAQTFLESVRAYTRTEVESFLMQSGLAVDRLYGNFEGEEFRGDSERLILVGSKRG
jgi:SAM-dependent methyltransferase